MFEPLSVPDMLFSIIAGIVLCLVYMYLLWQTIVMLPKIQHKKMWLAGSVFVRLAIFLFFGATLAYGSGSRFLIIVLAFFTTRIIVLRYVKKSIHNTLMQKKNDNKKAKKKK